jgi:hypothetical protein
LPRYFLRSGVVVEGFRALERMIRDDRRSPEDVRILVEGTRFEGEKVLEAHAGELQTIAANGDLSRLAALIQSTEANAGALSATDKQDPYPVLEQVVRAFRSGETPALAMRRDRIVDLLG